MTNRILVVEDDDSVLSFTLAVLKAEGHEVMAAESIQDARALLASQPDKIDKLCLVIDVVLHHESGIEFAHELIKRYPTVRVLLISGYTDDVLMTGGEDDSRTAFLAKPFTRLDLIGAVGKLCA